METVHRWYDTYLLCVLIVFGFYYGMWMLHEMHSIRVANEEYVQMLRGFVEKNNYTEIIV